MPFLFFLAKMHVTIHTVYHSIASKIYTLKAENLMIPFRFFKILPVLLLATFMNQCVTSKYEDMLPIPHKERLLIAITNVHNKTGDKRYDPMMDDLSGSYIHELSETHSFRVVERQQLIKILEEQKLSMTGLVDPGTVRRVGRLLGVEAVMIVELTSVTITEDKTGLGTLSHITQKIEIEMNARLVDSETGEVLSTSRVLAPIRRSFTALSDVFKSGDEAKIETVVFRAMQRIAKKLAYEMAYNYREGIVPIYLDN